MALGVARSTAHRLLTTLEQHGFARRDPATRTYLPGPALGDLGLATADLELRRASRGELQRLSDAAGETVHLVVLEGASVLFLDSVETSKALRIGSRIGAVMPAHCTSAGKAMLAEFTLDELRRLYARSERLEQVTPKSIATLEALEGQLATIRKQGYATNVEESELGVSAIAATIPGGPASRPAAFSVSAPTTRLTDERAAEIARAVMRATTAVIRSD